MKDRDPKLWTTSKLLAFLEEATLAYRQGSQIIDDDSIDSNLESEPQKKTLKDMCPKQCGVPTSECPDS